MDQRVRDRAGAGSARCERRSACRRRRAAPGRRGDRRRRRRPAGSRPESLPSIGRSRRARARRSAGSSRGSTAGDDRATLAADVAEAQAAARGRARRTDARRAAAGRTRGAGAARRGRAARGRPSPRRGCARREARLAQRDETLRTGGGAASGNAFVLRAPIAGRVAEVMATLGASYDEGRAALPDRRAPIASSCRRRCRRPTCARVARRRRPRARDSRARRSDRRCKPHHMHDAGVIDPTTRALPVQIRGRQSAAASCWSARPARPCSTPAARSACRPCPKAAVLMEAGRPYVFVQTGGETLRPPLRRDRRARRRPGRRQERRQARRARRRRAARTTCSSRRRPRGCRPKATCTEGTDETH